MTEDKPFYWYVMQVISRREQTVIDDFNSKFDEQDYKAFIPKTKFLLRRKGQKDKWVDKPMFPGYIFVEAPAPEASDKKQCGNAQYDFLQDTALFTRSDTNGAIRVLQYCDGDAAIHENEMRFLLRALDDKRCLGVSIAVQEGDKVVIKQGVLVGIENEYVIKHVNRHKREVIIEFNFMGQPQQAHIPVEFVDKVS
jgi:transcription antitermination factor NusG